MAWFCGADLRILDEVPSERRFYETLGTGVFCLCAASGVSFTLAAAYWLQCSPGRVWWLGAGWFLLMVCAIEPLVYQTATSHRRHLALVLAPRVALSLLIAIQIGEPLVLRINAGAINAYISTHLSQAERAAETKSDSFYEAQVRHAEQRITAIHARERTLAHRVTRNEFLSACERNTPSCSYTGAPGCSTYCIHYARVAAEAQSELNNLRRSAKGELRQLKSRIAGLERRRESQIRRQLRAISRNHGLEAREVALGALEHSNPFIRNETWFLRLFFFVLDLTPLIMKVVRLITLDSPYERRAQAERDQDSAEAHAHSEKARVRIKEATAEAEADIAIASERARARAMAAVNEIWDRFRWPRITRRQRSSERRPS